MRYETVKTLTDEDFKRLTGVSREMVEKILADPQKERLDFGRPQRLGRVAQLLRTLMYWCEFRTEFQLGIKYRG